MIALIAMLRIWFLSGLVATVVLGQVGLPDPAFDNIPFEQWLKGGGDERIHWSLRVSPPALSESQKLESGIRAFVDASEFAKRPEPGRMVLFIEIRDQDNHTYRSHRPLTLKSATKVDDLKDLRLSEHLCILPGDYEVAAAVYDTQSKEHSLKQTRLRVPELPHDLLREAWKGLPRVEAAKSCAPGNASRLSLTLSPEKPVRVEVVANGNVNRNPKTGALSLDANVQPRLNIISEVQVPNGSMHLTVLDLEHRRVTLSAKVIFSKAMLRRIGSSMAINDRFKINARGMEGYKDDAQFFVSEVRKRLENGGPDADPVLIVVSAPLTFRKEVDLAPIQTTAPTGTRVFYIRCESVSFTFSAPPPQLPSPGPVFVPPMAAGPTPPRIPYTNNADSLVGMLKPLQPRVFDVTTAADFRSALGTILREIAEQK